MTTLATADPVEIAKDLAARIAPTAAARDADREPLDAEVQLLKDSGLLSLFVPRRFGGLDANYRTALTAISIVAEANPNIAHIPQAHHCGVELLRFAEAVPPQEYYFPRIVAEGLLIPSAYSEIGTRTATDYKTVLTPKHDGSYTLDGEKFYVTGSRWGDAFFVPALIAGSDLTDGQSSLAVSFVDADAPGITVAGDWDAMGQRGTASGSVSLRGVPVNPEFVLTGDLGGASAYDYTGAHAQIIFCAIYLGTARAALRDAIGYVRERARPWIHSTAETAAADPYIAHHVGSLDVMIEAGEALLDRAADALDIARAELTAEAREAAAVAVSRAKVASSEAAVRVTNDIFQICGSGSTRAKWAFDRHWRNMRTLTLHDPVDYKYKILGDYRLTGAPPPISGWS